MDKCSICGGPNTGSQKYVCKGCHAARCRDYRRRNPEQFRARDKRYRERNRERLLVYQHDRNLFRKYGITSADYDTMLNAQGGICAACGQRPTEQRRLEVDHCHLTGSIRGLLCKGCNAAAGQAADMPERLRQIADYLERAQLEVTR